MSLLRALPRRLLPIQIRKSSSTSYNSSRSATHEGKQTSEHVTNSQDKLDIHSAASHAGQESRAKGDRHDSAATSEKHEGKSGLEKQKEWSPRSSDKNAGIGMQDERGGKGH